MHSQGTDSRENRTFGDKPPSRFKPTVQYVTALDRVVVTAKDGPLTEIWSDCNLHLKVETSRLAHRKVVGFCLDGCRALARGTVQQQDGRFSIIDLINFLACKCPSTPRDRLDQARAVVRKLDDQFISLPGTLRSFLC